MKIKRTVEMKIKPVQLQINDRIVIDGDLWKVLDVQDKKVLIWKYTNITPHIFDKEDNCYEGSEIQKYLQSDFLKTVPTWLPENITEKGFFLLTKEQIEKYMPDELDRIAVTGSKTIYTTYYWTASPSDSNYYENAVCYVDSDGTFLRCDGDNYAGVAPACWMVL